MPKKTVTEKFIKELEDIFEEFIPVVIQRHSEQYCTIEKYFMTEFIKQVDHNLSEGSCDDDMDLFSKSLTTACGPAILNNYRDTGKDAVASTVMSLFEHDYRYIDIDFSMLSDKNFEPKKIRGKKKN